MATKTKTKKAAAPKPAAPSADQNDADVPAAVPAEERLELRPKFEVGLSQPGEDAPLGARRFSCPDCGAKHDVIRVDAVDGQAGTWTVENFKCVAGCGYIAAQQPVT